MVKDLDKAIELFNTFKFDEAKAIFTEILQKEPDNLNARLYLGKIFFKNNEHGKSLGEFNAVLENDPDNNEAITNIEILKSILNLNNNYYYENPYTDDNLYKF